jgi:hypothetical protein
MLGMVAMLGALIAVPLATASALAVSKRTAAHAMAHEMPCHKPVKPCPHCPQKVCADMGNCLIKCFQSLYAPVAGGAGLPVMMVGSRLPPGLSQVANGSLIPPLLRPPSV